MAESEEELKNLLMKVKGDSEYVAPTLPEFVKKRRGFARCNVATFVGEEYLQANSSSRTQTIKKCDTQTGVRGNAPRNALFVLFSL